MNRQIRGLEDHETQEQKTPVPRCAFPLATSGGHAQDRGGADRRHSLRRGVSPAFSGLRHAAVLPRTGALSRSLRLREQRTPAVPYADGVVRHGQRRSAPGQRRFCQTGRHFLPRQPCAGQKRALAESQGYSNPRASVRHDRLRQDGNARFPVLQRAGNSVRPVLHRPQSLAQAGRADMANGAFSGA